ncbi:EAL domain-containing protein [Arcobacter sp. FWKO B]|uniref:EAL domain-containing protein n=1 Tax=Arcobacter sp. FWKO B TaxID=2593672 RepID=UPI0018A679CE|nr:EAL domain-containing protein [Arcobacter sp. FWKO B]QOG12918.1 EAL domain-containing protein [Arcobacter sp. FWKO B]
MKRLSYKTTFILFVAVSAIIFFVATIVLLKIFDKTDVAYISQINIEKKYEEKLKTLEEHYNTIDSSLKYLISIDEIKEFYKNNQNKYIISKLLNATKNSVPSIYNLSYVSFDGYYKISTDTNYNELQHQNILGDFIAIDSTPLFIHKDGIMLNPYTNNPYVKLLIAINPQLFNSDYLVVDVELAILFNQLQMSMLYDFYIINNSGEFILHPNQNLTYKEMFDNKISIFEDSVLSKYSSDIIKNKKYIFKEVFSSELPIFSLKNHKMILKLKYNTLSQERVEVTDFIIIVLAFFTILIIVASIYFSKKPDNLLKEVKYQLFNDPTTNLPNKAQLIEDLEDNSTKIIILIEVDNFKEINNVYGYDMADEMLKKYAMILKQLLSSRDSDNYKLYKMPSNVFAITYTYNKNYSQLKTTVSELHRLIEKETISCGERCAVHLSVTLGVSDPRHIHHIKEELIEAELALTMAKFNNKKFVIYHKHSTIQEESENALYWTKEIKTAISQDRIMTFFQPILNNKTKKIEKYEVLMRLLDSKGNIVTPYKFMEIAKVSKQYIDLTKIIIHKAFSFFEKRDVEFSINISTLDLFEDDFIAYLKDEIRYYNIQNKLVIELIESEKVHDYSVVETFMKDMKSLGVKIAIDDFGSGYSNFEHIVNLHEFIDYVKIDGSLIKNIGSDDNKSLAILKTIKVLCEQLNIKTIAEFIDNDQKLECINDVGIDFSQGYLIGKPMGMTVN